MEIVQKAYNLKKKKTFNPQMYCSHLQGHPHEVV